MSFIKSFFGKKPNQVTKDDVEDFIRKKFEESKNLDYKEIDVLRNRAKLCKHVCAFANSEGGLLLLGVSELKESHRIYPDKITWGDPSYTKEQLENILLGNLSPHVKLDIIPIRKSQNDQSVIFLIDVQKSNKLHMANHIFYKRENFQSLPMSHNEIVSFIRERLKFDECAMFRFQLKEFIFELVDEMLAGLIPGMTLEKRKQVREDFEQTLQNLIEEWNQIKNTIFAETPIIEIIRFADHLDNIYVEKLKQLERYPYNEITPVEKIYFIELKELMNDFQMSFLREFFIDDAKAHGVTNNWRESSLEFEKRTKHEEHVRDIVRADLNHLRNILENFLKIISKYQELEAGYGSFRESPSVKCYFD